MFDKMTHRLDPTDVGFLQEDIQTQVIEGEEEGEDEAEDNHEKEPVLSAEISRSRAAHA